MPKKKKPPSDRKPEVLSTEARGCQVTPQVAGCRRNGWNKRSGIRSVLDIGISF